MSFLSGIKTFFGGEPSVSDMRTLEISQTERRLAIVKSLSEHYASAQELYTKRLERLLQEKAAAGKDPAA